MGKTMNLAAVETQGDQYSAQRAGLEGQAARLLARIASGRDREAFADLFDGYAPRLKSFMMRKGASPELAEDLVQETMIAVWTKAGLYAPERGSVTTWIFTIARNLRIDRLRRESAAHLSELGDYDEVSDEPDGEAAVMAAQEARRISGAMRSLPPEMSDILRLSFVEDVPQSEIARRLNIPLGTVKSRMRLAYGRLRHYLESTT